jgi:DNA-binding CsgD family transcriptional regulator
MKKCPECGSPKFFSTLSDRKGLHTKCLDCGYTGSLIRGTSLLALSEVRCIELLKLGFQNKEIQRTLGIKEMTVKNQLWAARKKLDAKNAPHLIYICLKEGIIE